MVTDTDLLAESIINITAKNILNCSVPVAIVAATKEKKIALEKFMRESAKKSSFWMAELSLHAYKVYPYRLWKIYQVCKQTNSYPSCF